MSDWEEDDVPSSSVGGWGELQNKFGLPINLPRGGNKRSCYKCFQDGHVARDCTSFITGAEHAGPSRQDQGKQTAAGRGCFKCLQDGHVARDCTSFITGAEHAGPSRQDQGKQTAAGRGCFKCGEEGHMSRFCNKVNGETGDRRQTGFNRGNEGGPEPQKEKIPDERRGVPLYMPDDLEDDKLFDTGIQVGQNFERYSSMTVQVTGDDPIPQPASEFADMGLREILKENIIRANYKLPTPVQKYSIPIILKGRDIMACAETGCGKTAAFLLPMIHYILENQIESHAFGDCVQPVGLILSPTRELVIQICDEGRKFSLNTVVKFGKVYGGANSKFQNRRLMEFGCHILVATPGRLMDNLSHGIISFNELKFLVFDEADRMLDLGFIDDMKTLVSHHTMPPKGLRQTLMFSATFPVEIQHCAAEFLDNYIFIVVGVIGTANTDVTQEIVSVESHHKREKLMEYMRSVNCDGKKILIFVETRVQTDFTGAYLNKQGITATTIHGDRFQNQREEALAAFKTGQINVLVATSVAARGLDIVGVEFVINYDLPKSVEEYVHRIGRTGRVGNPGHALSFFDEKRDLHLAKDLMKIFSEANQEVPDWFMQTADMSGLTQTYHGSGQFSSTDIRSRGARARPDEPNFSETYGGPPPPPNDDDGDLWAE